MLIEFTLLCPERKCHKCIAMEKLVEQLINEHFPKANIVHLHSPQDLLTFDTWIVPSLFLNGKPIARGYVPNATIAIDRIMKILNQDLKH